MIGEVADLIVESNALTGAWALQPPRHRSVFFVVWGRGAEVPN